MGTKVASAPNGEPAEACAAECNAVALLAGQNQALELIAGNAPLGEVLDLLMRLIESQAPGLLCSVLLLEGEHLRIGGCLLDEVRDGRESLEGMMQENISHAQRCE